MDWIRAINPDRTGENQSGVSVRVLDLVLLDRLWRAQIRSGHVTLRAVDWRSDGLHDIPVHYNEDLILTADSKSIGRDLVIPIRLVCFALEPLQNQVINLQFVFIERALQAGPLFNDLDPGLSDINVLGQEHLENSELTR
jgi:hypothetical protein